ncbi:hypothetical protein KC357_g8409 [Hortaea werneckii]|nr:hypothetical protein KC357_g8409 [Hortaea werneckii]
MAGASPIVVNGDYRLNLKMLKEITGVAVFYDTGDDVPGFFRRLKHDRNLQPEYEVEYRQNDGKTVQLIKFPNTLPATFGQVSKGRNVNSGSAACSACDGGRGRFLQCVQAQDDSGQKLYSGACMNCLSRSRQSHCTLSKKYGQIVPRKRAAVNNTFELSKMQKTGKHLRIPVDPTASYDSPLHAASIVEAVRVFLRDMSKGVKDGKEEASKTLARSEMFDIHDDKSDAEREEVPAAFQSPRSDARTSNAQKTVQGMKNNVRLSRRRKATIVSGSHPTHGSWNLSEDIDDEEEIKPPVNELAAIKSTSANDTDHLHPRPTARELALIKDEFERHSIPTSNNAIPPHQSTAQQQTLHISTFGSTDGLAAQSYLSNTQENATAGPQRTPGGVPLASHNDGLPNNYTYGTGANCAETDPFDDASADDGLSKPIVAHQTIRQNGSAAKLQHQVDRLSARTA